MIEKSTISAKASQSTHRAVQLTAAVNQDIKRTKESNQLWLTMLHLLHFGDSI